jgi:hypothetical protein
MEVAEEMGLIGFDILWQGESGGLPVRRRYQREESQKNPASRDQTMVAGVYPTVLGNPKWKSRFEHLTESFSTECPSLSMMLAVIGQIEVMRCFTARTWALRKAGRG